MAKTDITPEGMEAQIQQEAPQPPTPPGAKKNRLENPRRSFGRKMDQL